MGFHVLAKHGLNKHGLKDPKLVSFGGEKNRERKKTGREEEEKERRREPSKPRYGTTNFEYGLGFLVWILGFVWLMVCPKPRV